jgi:hypothetical protein
MEWGWRASLPFNGDPNVTLATFSPVADPTPEAPPPGQVRVRVLPLGHQKVFTGAMNPKGETVEARFPRHDKGAIFTLPRAVAEAQEARGFVEIEDGEHQREETA